MCNADGQWFRHPESNRVWTNYTQCQAYTKDKRKVKHDETTLCQILKLDFKKLVICLLSSVICWKLGA